MTVVESVVTDRLLAAVFGGNATQRFRSHRDVYKQPFLATQADTRLIDEVSSAGLLGRGGAAFPTAVKMRAVAGQKGKPVVVVNASEGEPLSYKDATLVTSAPNLIIDGAMWAARSVGAREIIICVKDPSLDAGMAIEQALAVRAAAGETVPARVEYVPPRFVVGEESALINWINNKVAKPTLRPPATFEKGVGGRPTLVDNAETLAHLALIANFGGAWFRECGTDNESGTTLVTIAGDVAKPGVYEFALGRPIVEVLQAAGLRNEPQALLIGGYFGTWIRWDDARRARLTNSSLGKFGSSVGCGVIYVLSSSACGIRETARVLKWIESQSAGQCGSCVFGLGSVADMTSRVYLGQAPDDALQWLERWSGQIAGRGACRLPDGAVRLLQSAMQVFSQDIKAHQTGQPCAGSRVSPLLPIPSAAS